MRPGIGIRTRNSLDCCGVRPLAREARIVNGERSDFAEWPWQALVKESTWLGIFTKNKCGGVLLNKRYVLTAAHCQPGFLASLIVVLGEYDLSDDYEPKQVVQRNVKRVIVHRGYVAKTFDNDLALLEMERPVTFEEHIVPICMPQGNEDFVGKMGYVTGWGRLSYGGPVPTQLNEVELPIITNSECQHWFTEAGHIKNIKPEFFCAGYKLGKKDSCEGDSGGPLSIRGDDGRWILAGTVSHGIKCAYPNLPGVYMRMTYYKPWIESIIN
nr:serine protease filzig-like [Procambarus clarkii]